MAGTGVLQPPLALAGRERECAVIDGVLERALAGEAGSLVVRGVAGIGKSTLLDYAARAASGMTVLRATGVEAESDVAFAGLYGLARPVVDKLGEVPVTQREVLAGALGLAPSAGADRLLVSAAVLSLLAAAAEESPVLCAIDDAQWLDRPSADALVFSARRLHAERLVMLFGVRVGDARTFEAADLPELVLEGLDAPFAAAMLAGRTPAPAPAVHERLLVEAAGNPLALLELPEALSAAQLAGDAPLPEKIPLTPRLQGVFLRRIERLPTDTQDALLIAAADDTGDLATVIRAAARTQLPFDALDAAETSDLIRISDGTVAFRHPLVRSALYDAATQGRRRQAHAALAEVLSGEEHADRRVWHQAMATVGADEEVAAALEASARRSQARAAQSSAASALLRAAELSTDDQRRGRRIAAAAQAAWDAGQPDRAREAIARALPLADGELKARLLLLNGVIEARCGSLPKALPQLLEGAELTQDTTLLLEILTQAGEVAAFSGELQTLIEIGERFETLPARTGRERLLRDVLTGFGLHYALRYEEAQPLLAEAVREAEALDTPRELVLAAMSAVVVSDFGQGLANAARAVEILRRRGLLSDLAGALEWQGFELTLAGIFDHAHAAAEEGYRLSLDVGSGSVWHLANLAWAEAGLGQIDGARQHAEAAISLGRSMGANFMTGRGEWALAFIDLATGRPQEALDRLLPLTAVGTPGVNPILAVWALPDTIEAAVRAGRVDRLGTRPAFLAEALEAAPTEQRLAVLARCEALLELRPPAEAFEEALGRAPVLTPLERGRTELLYGEWLRRERRRKDARVHLRLAFELFRDLGMRLFAERAEAELRATGETARKRDPSTLDDLTPQELQIAGLVVQGLTNREIAAQLFLSPRTIDYHLHKVFNKLGIASRTELIRSGVPTRQAI